MAAATEIACTASTPRGFLHCAHSVLLRPGLIAPSVPASVGARRVAAGSPKFARHPAPPLRRNAARATWADKMPAEGWDRWAFARHVFRITLKIWPGISLILNQIQRISIILKQIHKFSMNLYEKHCKAAQPGSFEDGTSESLSNCRSDSQDTPHEWRWEGKSWHLPNLLKSGCKTIIWMS